MPTYNPGGYVGSMDYGPYGNYGTIRYPTTGGGGGMPPAVIAGGIAAAGALGSAAMQSRAAGRAAESSERTTSEALAFQREQAEKEAAWLERQYQTYMQGRQALLDKYGITLPEMPGLSPGGPPGEPPGAVPRGRGVGDLAGAPQYAAVSPGAVPPRRGGVGDLAGVFDWRARGLGA